MSTGLPPAHIALLDDHQLFRQGITYILKRLPYVASVAEAATYAELQALLSQSPRLPDVLLLDLQMPEIDGIEAARLLLAQHDGLKIIVLSMYAAEHFVAHMLKLGVRGYLHKDSDPTQLSAAIEAVLTEGYYFTPATSRAMARGLQAPTRRAPSLRTPTVVLTQRETDILTLLCQGRSVQHIAQQLFISGRTVEWHRQNLLEKTGTHSTVSLVLYALKHGLVSSEAAPWLAGG